MKSMEIPILVNVDGKDKIVSKDISNLSLESLIKLKKCLSGINPESSLALEEIIYYNALSGTKIGYDDSSKAVKRARKKQKDNFGKLRHNNKEIRR